MVTYRRKTEGVLHLMYVKRHNTDSVQSTVFNLLLLGHMKHNTDTVQSTVFSSGHMKQT